MDICLDLGATESILQYLHEKKPICWRQKVKIREFELVANAFNINSDFLSVQIDTLLKGARSLWNIIICWVVWVSVVSDSPATQPTFVSVERDTHVCDDVKAVGRDRIESLNRACQPRIFKEYFALDLQYLAEFEVFDVFLSDLNFLQRIISLLSQFFLLFGFLHRGRGELRKEYDLGTYNLLKENLVGNQRSF